MSLRPLQGQPDTDRLARVLRAGLRFYEQPQAVGVSSGKNARSPANSSGQSEPGADSKKQKKQKKTYPPCHPELRYQEEKLPHNSYRVSGGSSKFYFKPLDGIPLNDDPGDVKRAKAIAWADGVMVPMIDVVDELYRNVEPSQDSGPERKSQYYTHTLQNPATVVHIITDGMFWNSHTLEERSGRVRAAHDVGQFAYTYGIVWCQTSPNWKWKGTGENSKVSIRCRIELPAGTQVIIDRDPVRMVSNIDCKPNDDESWGRFPDILLLPGEFEIVDVKSYMTENYESDDENSGKYQEDKIEELPPVDTTSPGTEKSDGVYASEMLRDTGLFLDVRLRVKRMMKVPAMPFTK